MYILKQKAQVSGVLALPPRPTTLDWIREKSKTKIKKFLEKNV